MKRKELNNETVVYNESDFLYKVKNLKRKFGVINTVVLKDKDGKETFRVSKF